MLPHAPALTILPVEDVIPSSVLIEIVCLLVIVRVTVIRGNINALWRLHRHLRVDAGTAAVGNRRHRDKPPANADRRNLSRPTSIIWIVSVALVPLTQIV